jgi:hypothetical protein
MRTVMSLMFILLSLGNAQAETLIECGKKFPKPAQASERMQCLEQNIVALQRTLTAVQLKSADSEHKCLASDRNVLVKLDECKGGDTTRWNLVPVQ